VHGDERPLTEAMPEPDLDFTIARRGVASRATPPFRPRRKAVAEERKRDHVTLILGVADQLRRLVPVR
jgi:hypothetical protein